MSIFLTFDDVLISPKFSFKRSRKEVDLSTDFLGYTRTLPVISANMDTITDADMAIAMAQSGGVGCLHRFWDVQRNVAEFKSVTKTDNNAIVSIGLGDKEFERASALIEMGATHICIDVAHGAQIAVVEQYDKLRNKYGNSIFIIVGNFASGNSIVDFSYHMQSQTGPDGYKIGVGPGSACTTRIKTGVGIPQLSAIIECAKVTDRIIADGGMKTPGDISKALAAGAQMVMLGGMLAGTDETPGEIIEELEYSSKYEQVTKNDFASVTNRLKYKTYRGSASKESYEAQGKTGTHRTTEGESFKVPYKGSVKEILQDIEGGIRSTCTQVNASTLAELRTNVEFVQITANSVKENGAHGKTT